MDSLETISLMVVKISFSEAKKAHFSKNCLKCYLFNYYMKCTLHIEIIINLYYLNSIQWDFSVYTRGFET